MIDCTKCKHWVSQDVFNAYYDCKLGMLLRDKFAKLQDCSGYEPKVLDKEDIEIMEQFRAIPEGKKYDTGKNRMGLMCENFSRALWAVGEVSTFGASKYSENSWQNLSNPKSRYMDALCRHLFQHLQGEKIDDESGLLHLQHCAWNILALLEFELKESEENNEH